jgi:hypothetical protein
MKKFFANLTQESFDREIDDEISEMIIPHLDGIADNGYPFRSSEGMIKLHMKGNLVTHSLLRQIENAAGKMSQAEGDAFRFIAYRDLSEAMVMYLEFAKMRPQNRKQNNEKSVLAVA